MKYCDKCKVIVRGTHEECPLCQRALVPLPKEEKRGVEQNVFPVIPSIYQKHQMAFKIINFISVACIVISLVLNRLIAKEHWWSLFVIAGVVCFWGSFFIVFRKRKNIPKTLLYQVVMISGISVLWDKITEWKGWSIDFVIPILCMIDLIVLYILSKVLRDEVEDGLVYTLLGGVLGLIPLIFYLFGWLHFVIPSLISVTASILYFAGMIIFQGEKIKEELKRRLHY